MNNDALLDGLGYLRVTRADFVLSCGHVQSVTWTRTVDFGGKMVDCDQCGKRRKVVGKEQA